MLKETGDTPEITFTECGKCCNKMRLRISCWHQEKLIRFREFVEKAFAQVDIKVRWEGEGVAEKGYNAETNEILVEVDEQYFRPTEVELLLGDPTKAKEKLGWKHKISFEELVKEMVAADLKLFEKDKYLLEGGHQTFDYNE